MSVEAAILHNHISRKMKSVGVFTGLMLELLSNVDVFFNFHVKDKEKDWWAKNLNQEEFLNTNEY